MSKKVFANRELVIAKVVENEVSLMTEPSNADHIITWYEADGEVFAGASIIELGRQGHGSYRGEHYKVSSYYRDQPKWLPCNIDMSVVERWAKLVVTMAERWAFED